MEIIFPPWPEPDPRPRFLYRQDSGSAGLGATSGIFCWCSATHDDGTGCQVSLCFGLRPQGLQALPPRPLPRCSVDLPGGNGGSSFVQRAPAGGLAFLILHESLCAQSPYCFENSVPGKGESLQQTTCINWKSQVSSLAPRFRRISVSNSSFCDSNRHIASEKPQMNLGVFQENVWVVSWRWWQL